MIFDCLISIQYQNYIILLNCKIVFRGEGKFNNGCLAICKNEGAIVNAIGIIRILRWNMDQTKDSNWKLFTTPFLRFSHQ